MNEPEGWLDELTPLPDGVRLYERASEPLDVIVYFSDERANVERRVPFFAQLLAADGVLWSAVPADSTTATPDVAAAAGRAGGLVPDGSIPIGRAWTATRLRKPLS